MAYAFSSLEQKYEFQGVPLDQSHGTWTESIYENWIYVEILLQDVMTFAYDTQAQLE